MFVSVKREQEVFHHLLSPPPRNSSKTANKVGVEKIKSKSQPTSGKTTTSGWKLESRTKTITKVPFLCLCVFFDTAQKVLQQKSFSIESAFESFSAEAQQQSSPELAVSVRFPPFSILLKQKNLRHRGVWQPENVYNHLKYITVRSHYANRTYFCHFPS